RRRDSRPKHPRRRECLHRSTANDRSGTPRNRSKRGRMARRRRSVIDESTVAEDRRLRQLIYAKFADGQRPTARDFAQLLGTPVQAVLAGFKRLAAARALVLQPDGEILMAEPFSAVPTAF